LQISTHRFYCYGYPALSIMASSREAQTLEGAGRSPLPGTLNFF
jgi:hypothetical protein